MSDDPTLPSSAATGYDPVFLGVDVPLPVAPAGRPVVRLDSTHFTVLLDPVRRLAAATGVVIDGAALRDLERGDDWHLDPRVPESEQAGPELYAANDLDRGHLVRRRDPVWGDAATAERANRETFVYTNAAPQAGEFNQSQQLWAGLEDYLLGHARTYADRLAVMTGPVLDDDDPSYRGVLIPRLFWKVAAWSEAAAGDGSDGDGSDGDGSDGDGSDGERRDDDGSGRVLASTAYVLDQTPQLDDIDLHTARAAAAGDPPPLGPYRTYQVPVADVAALTGLDLGPLVAADRLPAGTVTGALPAPRQHWVELNDTGSIVL